MSEPIIAQIIEDYTSEELEVIKQVADMISNNCPIVYENCNNDKDETCCPECWLQAAAEELAKRGAR